MPPIRAFFAHTQRAALGIAAGCIVLIAALWAVALERAGYEREQTIAATVRHNANLALSLEQHIGRTLQNVDQLLLFAAHEVQEHPGLVNIARWKSHRAIDASMVSFLGYADADGMLVFGSAEFLPISVADREYFQYHRARGMRDLHIGKPFVGRVSGRQEIPVSRRVNGPEGEFRGVVVAGVDIRYFAGFYEEIDIGRHGSLNLVGRDGVIRARKGLQRTEAGHDLRDSTLLRAAAQKPVGDVMTRGQVDGIARFMSYRTIPEYDLVVAIGTSSDEMLAGVAAKRRDYLAGALLGSLLIAALGLALAVTLSRQRRAAEERRRANASYRATFDQAAVGIAHATVDGVLLKANAKLCSMLGYAEAELLGRPFIDLVHPQDAGAVLDDKRQRLSGELPERKVQMEMRCIRKDGEVIWTDVAVTFVPGAEGEPEYLLSLLQDVTDRKNAETALRGSEERFRSLLELSSDFYWETDAEHRFVHRGGQGKTSAVEVFEKGRHLGLRRWEIPYLSPDEAGWRGHRAVLDAHQPFRNFEISRLGSDDTERFQTLSGNPLFDATGAFLGYRGVGTDITERKRAERELSESRERYRDLVDNASDFIWELDRQMRFTFASGNLKRLIGFDAKDVLGHTPFEFMAPDEAAQGRAWAAEIVGARRAFNGMTHSVLNAAGEKRTWEVSGVPILTPEGELQGYRGVSRDITDRKRAERALKRSEQRFRSYFELGLVGMAVSEPGKNLVEVNDRLCEMLGYDREELLRMQWAQLTHPDDLRAELPHFERMLAGESNSYTIEKRFVRRDGGAVPARISVGCVRKRDGTPDYFVGLIDDLTERKRAEQRLAATFNQAAVGMVTCTAQMQIIEANARFAAMLGYRPEEMIGRAIADLTHPEDIARSRELADGALKDPCGPSPEFEKRLLHRDGSIVWVMVTRALVKDANGRPDYFVAVVRDITERKKVLEQARKAEAQYRATFEQSAVGIAHAALDGRFIKVNARYGAMLGYTEEELLGRSFAAITHPDDVQANVELLQRLASDEQPADEWQFEKRYLCKDGTELWALQTISVVRNAAGGPEYFVTVAQDVSARKAAEAKLEHHAQYDALTGLPNRALLGDRLAQALAQAKRKRWTTGVLYLNIDRFKAVNGTFGHRLGDEVLRGVAQRLQACVRVGDSVARIGADEFAVVLGELAQATDAKLVGRKILDALAIPFQVLGREVVLSGSIGIATEPPDGDSGESLLRNAGVAMARAKETGRNGIQFYSTGMNERASRQLELQADLRRALERNEFFLHFQPKAALDSGQISGFEALLRWQPAGKSLVSPADFIPLLEETGMIVPVGAWVIGEACRRIGAWSRAGLRPVPVAINVSAKQFTDDLHDVIAAALAEHRVEAGMLEVEITESDAMRDPDRAIAVLQRLRRLGVGVSIDDFGTGYSSLGYLKRFPVQSLKLDRSFVMGLPDDADDVSIAKAVISMAHSLGLKVVAEGVETETQRGFLALNRCDQMQGYLLSRPLPGDHCMAYLAPAAAAAAPVV